MYRDDCYDPQLDEMRLREEIDFFLDHLSTEQFGAALLWMSTYDDQKEAVLNRWVGAIFLGVQPLPHEIAQVRDWMTDYLSKDIIMYKELLDLYS